MEKMKENGKNNNKKETVQKLAFCKLFIFADRQGRCCSDGGRNIMCDCHQNHESLHKSNFWSACEHIKHPRYKTCCRTSSKGIPRLCVLSYWCRHCFIYSERQAERI